jgi:hypothetical protein
MGPVATTARRSMDCYIGESHSTRSEREPSPRYSTITTLVSKIALFWLVLVVVGSTFWPSPHDDLYLFGDNGNNKNSDKKNKHNNNTNHDHRENDGDTLINSSWQNTVKESENEKAKENNCRYMNCTNTTPPTTLNIPQSTWTFLHVGKAGGGTHVLRTRSWWHLNVHQCHPQPCPAQQFQNLNDQLLNKLMQNQPQNQGPKVPQLPNLPHLTLSLRDPVDRFVSAFYWSRNFCCSPPGLYVSYNGSITDSSSSSGDTRIVASPKDLYVKYNTDLEHYCRSPSNDDLETYFLQNFHDQNRMNSSATTPTPRYYNDLSTLAEALCEDHPLYPKANRLLRRMQHLHYELEDWMPWWNATGASNTATTTSDTALRLPLLQKTWMEQLVPIVLEPSYDLVSQIDAATNWVINRTTDQFRDTSSQLMENDDKTNKKKLQTKNLEWAQRQRYASCLDCGPLDDDMAWQVARQEHSSFIDKGSYSSGGEIGSGYSANDGNTDTKVNDEMVVGTKSQAITTPPLRDLHHPLLSKRGETCAIKFYRRDYQTLPKLLDGKACKFNTCEQALESILNRRREHLVFGLT